METRFVMSLNMTSAMKYNSSQNGSGQRDAGYRGGRGGRGRKNSGNRGQNRGPRDDRESNSYEPRSGQSRRQEVPPKLTFWQKLIGFFTGKRSQAPEKSPSAASNRPLRSQSSAAETVRSAAPRIRETRKPELIEVTSPKLYVGNLSFDATESDLFDLFNGVGKVHNAEIVSNAYTQKSKGFAFVTMETVAEAKRAVTELHDKEYMGRKLVVSGAKTSDVRNSRSAAPATEQQSAPERADIDA